MKLLLLLVLTINIIKTSKANNIVTIAVASNYIHRFKKVINSYKKENPSFNYFLVIGSSGKLYSQIINGAKIDIFFSADSMYPTLLQESNRIIKNSKFTYTFGKLLLWKKNKEYKLNSKLVKKIAIANPKLAPFGRAAVEYFKKLNLYKKIEPKIITSNNVAAVNMYISTNSVEMALISDEQKKLINIGFFELIPKNLYKPIIQQAVLLNDSKQILHFINYFKRSLYE